MKEAAAVILPLREAHRDPVAPPVESHERSLADLVRAATAALWRHAGLLLASLCVGLALGAAVLALRVPVYTAQAAIVIDPRLGDDGLGDQAPTIFLADALIVDSEVEVIRSERLMSRVAASLGLIGQETDAGGPQHRAALDTLARAVLVEREARTYVIRIEARSDRPQMARQIADAVADSYFKQRTEMQQRKARDAGQWLSDEAKRLSEELMGAERRVAAFLTTHGLSESREDDPVLRELTQVRAAQTELRQRIAQAEAEAAALSAHLARAGDDARRLAELLDPALTDPALTRLQTQLSDLLARLSLDPNAPTQTAGTALTDQLSAAIATEIARRADARLHSVETARREAGLLTAREAELAAQARDRRDRRIELSALQREADILRARYDALISRDQASRALAPAPGIPARLIARPVTPDRASGASAQAVLGALAIGGLLVGVGLVFLRAQLDDRLRDPDDVGNRVGLRSLGVVPRMTRRDARDLASALPPWTRALPRAERHRLALAQAARDTRCQELVITLRRVLFALGIGKETTLQLGRDTPYRCIGITAAGEGDDEGKSLFAANLATYLARAGHAVLLVDGDLEKRTLTRSFAGAIGVEGRVPHPLGTDPGMELMRAPIDEGLELAFSAAPVTGGGGGAAAQALALMRALDRLGDTAKIPTAKIPTAKIPMAEMPTGEMPTGEIMTAEIVVIDLPALSANADPPPLSRLVDDTIVTAV
ncbi:MAG: Wzz/FepE/Etk N-terminal domain-containing protein, partial [Pseudomonadota bacterium]